MRIKKLLEWVYLRLEEIPYNPDEALSTNPEATSSVTPPLPPSPPHKRTEITLRCPKHQSPDSCLRLPQEVQQVEQDYQYLKADTSLHMLILYLKRFWYSSTKRKGGYVIGS